MKRFSLMLVVIITAVFGTSSFISSGSEVPEGMVLIPGGKGLKGSDDVFAQEGPIHEEITRAFYMDIHPETSLMHVGFRCVKDLAEN